MKSKGERILRPIGDKIRDCAICEQTDCKGFLVGDNEKPEIIDKVKDGRYDRVGYANSLADATMMILQTV